MACDAHWTELAAERASGRVFTRSLGLTETGFYWDAEFNGTADVTDHHSLVLTCPTLCVNDTAADEARFRAIWIATKQKYPLLAARVDESEDGNALAFIVSEQRTSTILPADEFEYIAQADQQILRSVIERGRNGPGRRLSREFPAALSVLRRAGSETEYDLVLTIAHMIIDGMSSFALARTLFDLLARWPASLETPPPDLRARLAMVPSCDSLHPGRSIPLPRRHWRRAIGAVINSIRVARLRGGHTLPNTHTAYTARTPATSRLAQTYLEPAHGRAALAACRAHGVTLGHALPVLAQAALARVLRRRLDSGVLSQADWEKRRASATHTGGPLNLRPHLAPAWLAAGGNDELNLAIGFFFATVPLMPNGDGEGSDYTGALSPQRFWLRAQGVKKQVESYYRHPLFLEIGRAGQPGRIARTRLAAEMFRREKAGERLPNPPPLDPESLVFANGGSSIGNVDPFLSYTFSLKPAGTETVRRVRSQTYLRCRPAELYLGAASMRGEMRLYVYYDANVYEESVVEEWLGEVKETMVCYLGERSEDSARAHL